MPSENFTENLCLYTKPPTSQRMLLCEPYKNYVASYKEISDGVRIFRVPTFRFISIFSGILQRLLSLYGKNLWACNKYLFTFYLQSMKRYREYKKRRFLDEIQRQLLKKNDCDNVVLFNLCIRTIDNYYYQGVTKNMRY